MKIQRNLLPRWKRKLRVMKHKMFPKRGDTHKVAWAVFIGIWIGVMPTIGIALPLTILVCKLFKLPIGPGMASSFVATPPTQFFMFYPLGYAIGVGILEPSTIHFDFLAEVKSLNFSNISEVVGRLWTQAREHVLGYLIGMTIVATITSIIGYIIAVFAMEKRKKKHLMDMALRKKNDIKLKMELKRLQSVASKNGVSNG